MSFGLQLFDGSGRLTLDLSKRCPKIHSTMTVGLLLGYPSQFVTVPGMIADGTWFIIFGYTTHATFTISDGGFTMHNQQYSGYESTVIPLTITLGKF